MIDNRYNIVDKLGEGGFGIVYKCYDTEKSENVAVKTCKSTNEEEIRRFKREVRLIERIKQKNVINIRDKSFSHDPIYFVMPLARCNLSQFLKTNDFNQEEIIELFIKVCEGVNSIHLSGEVHRDINPNNVLVMEGERLVISDLGLGKFEERDSTVLTKTDVMMGTRGYIPPEFMQLGGTKNADRRSDIFQLGKTLYYMLTEEFPHYIKKGFLDPSLEYIVLKSIKTDPDNRYQNVNQLVDGLRSYLNSLDPDTYPIISIDSEIETLKDELIEGTYSEERLENIIKYLYSLKADTHVFLEKFDNVPEEVYEIFIESLFDEFKQIITIYTDVLERFLNNYNYGFSYAETVARKMRKIYYNTNDNELKSLALKNILISSVTCNRWAAMDVFDSILLNIEDDTEAYIVSEMIKENMDLYSNTYDRINVYELHPRLQEIWRKIEEKEL